MNDDDQGEPPFNQTDYPCAVTLGFRNDEERRKFMGQLSDGWGENYVSLKWPWEQYVTTPEQGTGDAFHHQEFFGVEVFEDDDAY